MTNQTETPERRITRIERITLIQGQQISAAYRVIKALIRNSRMSSEAADSLFSMLMQEPGGNPIPQPENDASGQAINDKMMEGMDAKTKSHFEKYKRGWKRLKAAKLGDIGGPEK